MRCVTTRRRGSSTDRKITTVRYVAFRKAGLSVRKEISRFRQVSDELVGITVDAVLRVFGQTEGPRSNTAVKVTILTPTLLTKNGVVSCRLVAKATCRLTRTPVPTSREPTVSER